MLGFGRKRSARGSVTAIAPRPEDGETYDRYAASLYRQALLTLDDADLAAQVVCDVLVGECVRPGAPTERDAGRRLAVSAYWRCQQVAGAGPARPSQPGQRAPDGMADRTDSRGPLSAKDRGALGLVVFGGLGYVQASRELAIPPGDMAALLRAAVRGLSAPAAGRAGRVPTSSRLADPRSTRLASGAAGTAAPDGRGRSES